LQRNRFYGFNIIRYISSGDLQDSIKKIEDVNKLLQRNSGSVTMQQVRDIATKKLPDLNCTDVEAAVRTVLGTARSMGVTVTE
jgi:ribosomal protein L11